MIEEKKFNSIYKVREIGRNFCQTEGSDHYKEEEDNIEPAEFAIVNNLAEDWMIVNIIKYIHRFKNTRNPNDLKKIADYAHLLCGIELLKYEGETICSG